MVKVNEHNPVMDKIIKKRRSIRGFKEEKLPKELIEEIIRVGMLAPYDSSAFGDVKDFRRFFVFEKDSANSKKLVSILENNAKDRLKYVESLIKGKPFMKSKFQTPMNLLRIGVDKCVSGVTNAPYIIIVVELRNVSPDEHQTLAQVLENMRLKATALNLGFQLILLPCGNLSLITQMAGDEDLMKLLGLPIRKFAINGCAIS